MPSTTAPPASSDAPAPGRGLGAAPAWWPWALGLLVGLVVVGPGLAGGSLLSLDLLVTPEVPVPNGVWGLGPALSQRVPLFAGIAVVAALVGGPVATKAFLVGCTAAGFAGAVRLTRVLAPRSLPVPAAALVAAGVLWAAGPWALTRIGVGHLNLVWVVAVLPWALPRLCRPGDDLASAFLASLALALGGPGGGTLGLAVAAVGVACTVRRGRLAPTVGALLAPHLLWILPTAVLLWAGAGVDGAGSFATRPRGPGGWVGVAAGGGFWRPDQQIGAEGVLGAVVGVGLVVLAVVGIRRVLAAGGRSTWAAPATVAAVLGLVLALASAVPVVRSAYGWASELPVGAPLRESQRFLALWMVWLAPAAAVGAAEVARSVRGAWGRAVPVAALVAVLAVSVPGWWGIGGRLEPVTYPSSWAAARQVLEAEPGTAVALPWSEYPQLSFADGRQAFNPMPDYLGGDVISSYDPRFDRDRSSQEQVDGRAVVVDELVARLRDGGAVGDDLADLGVRWVVLAHEPGWEGYGALASDPGVRHVLDLDDLDLYETVRWPGPSSEGGREVAVDRPIPPLILTDAPAGAVLSVAGAPGWVQGWATPAEVTGDGRLRLAGDGGVVWFWPALVLVAVDVAVAVAAIGALRSRSRRYDRLLAREVPRG